MFFKTSVHFVATYTAKAVETFPNWMIFVLVCKLRNYLSQRCCRKLLVGSWRKVTLKNKQIEEILFHYVEGEKGSKRSQTVRILHYLTLTLPSFYHFFNFLFAKNVSDNDESELVECLLHHLVHREVDGGPREWKRNCGQYRIRHFADKLNFSKWKQVYVVLFLVSENISLNFTKTHRNTLFSLTHTHTQTLSLSSHKHTNSHTQFPALSLRVFLSYFLQKQVL